jgi:hypothetical protein
LLVVAVVVPDDDIELDEVDEELVPDGLRVITPSTGTTMGAAVSDTVNFSSGIGFWESEGEPKSAIGTRSMTFVWLSCGVQLEITRDKIIK